MENYLKHKVLIGEVIANINNSPMAIKTKNTQKLFTKKAKRATGKLATEKKKQTGNKK